MKISLALSGGAARGAFHLGAIEALLEKGYKIEAISGSSIGAIIGASLASGVSPKEQLHIYKSKEFRKIFKMNFFKGSLVKIDKGQEIVKKIVPIKNLEDAKIKLYITTIDLFSGKIVVFDRGNAKKIVLGSSALIPLFKPVKYKNYRLADGGIMDNLPVAPLKREDLPIFAIDLHPDEVGYKNSFAGILKRMIFLAWRSSVQKSKSSCDLYITDPKLNEYSLFKFKHLDDLFDLGYKRTMEILNSFKG